MNQLEQSVHSFPKNKINKVQQKNLKYYTNNIQLLDINKEDIFQKNNKQFENSTSQMLNNQINTF